MQFAQVYDVEVEGDEGGGAFHVLGLVEANDSGASSIELLDH